MSHTYAILEVSSAAYAEIKAKLEAAGYQHAFDDHREYDAAGQFKRDTIVIDMHGIALKDEG